MELGREKEEKSGWMEWNWFWRQFSAQSGGDLG